MTITINRNDVFEEVFLITGRTGQHAKDIENVSATEDEQNIIKSFWDDSLCELYDIVRRFCSLSETNDDATYLFELHPDWNDATGVLLTKCMKLFCVNFICAKWFNVSKKDEVAYYIGICDGLIDKIKRLLKKKARRRCTDLAGI